MPYIPIPNPITNHNPNPTPNRWAVRTSAPLNKWTVHVENRFFDCCSSLKLDIHVFLWQPLSDCMLWILHGYFQWLRKLQKGRLPPPLYFCLSKNCQKIFMSSIFSRNAKFEAVNSSSGNNFRVKLQFWARIITSVGNLRLSSGVARNFNWGVSSPFLSPFSPICPFFSCPFSFTPSLLPRALPFPSLDKSMTSKIQLRSLRERCELP